jgi:hypothetical protein
MTTFTVIQNLNLAPDAKIRSVDALAFRDNPIAIVEGDATAILAGHQIKTAALEDGAVTPVKSTNLVAGKVIVATRANGVTVFKVLDATMDYRDRFIKIEGRAYHGEFLADVQKMIPGGAQDDIIGINYGNGAANDRTQLDGWFYSRLGIATAGAPPFPDPCYAATWVGGGSSTTVYVRSTDGALMIHDPDPLGTLDNHAYDLMVQFSIDQGAH